MLLGHCSQPVLQICVLTLRLHACLQSMVNMKFRQNSEELQAVTREQMTKVVEATFDQNLEESIVSASSSRMKMQNIDDSHEHYLDPCNPVI